jgi:CHAD domain-containing protein
MDAAAKTALAPADDPIAADAPAPSRDAHKTRHPAKADPQGATPDPWIQVHALALKQLDRFMSLEPKVLRGDDPDAIHDLRVASRRLQQVFDLLFPAPRHGETRKLRRRIRRTRRVLGDVRNADVQLARVSKTLARKRTARRGAWEALHHYLNVQRSESFAKAVHKLGRQNLAAFYIRLKTLLAQHQQVSPESGEDQGEAPPTPSQRFEERVTGSLQGVWQAFEAQVAESHRDSQPSVIHGVRIAAKRLRYLVEVLHECGVAGSADTLAWLRELQDLLGNWHDLDVLEQMMVEMVARPTYLRENLNMVMEVEKLIVKNRTNKRTFRELYFRQTLEGADYQRVRNWAEGLELKIDN